jgi:cytochrome b pre-mRNA-processing protein 3
MLSFREAAVELAPREADGVTRAYGFDKAARIRGKVMIFGLFRGNRRRVVVATLYDRVAAAARSPGLYTRLGVPDTVEGRFEALVLHIILTVRSLQKLPPPAQYVAGDLTDAFFRDLDASLREMGVGDVSVPKKMKRLAEAFFGRVRAYGGPLDAGDLLSLAVALGRNIREDEAPAPDLADYALAAERGLSTLDLAALLDGGPRFPQPGLPMPEEMP